jgi:hypothetical protein
MPPAPVQPGKIPVVDVEGNISDPKTATVILK